MRLLITEIVTAHFLHIFFIPLYFNLTTTEIMPRFLPRKKVLLALSPYLQDDSLAFPGPFLNLFIESQKSYKTYIYYEMYVLFLFLFELRRPNRPMHFDFFRVSISFLCIHSAVKLRVLVVLSLLLFVLPPIFSLGKFLRLYKLPLFWFTSCCFTCCIYELYSFMT